jgi:hypothetical protein
MKIKQILSFPSLGVLSLVAVMMVGSKKNRYLQSVAFFLAFACVTVNCYVVQADVKMDLIDKSNISRPVGTAIMATQEPGSLGITSKGDLQAKEMSSRLQQKMFIRTALLFVGVLGGYALLNSSYPPGKGDPTSIILLPIYMIGGGVVGYFTGDIISDFQYDMRRGTDTKEAEGI